MQRTTLWVLKSTLPVRDHFRGGVDAGDAVSAGGQQSGQVAGAAADIQNPPLRRHPRQPDALQYGEGEPMKLLVPVAIVEPGEIVVERQMPAWHTGGRC